MISWPDYQFAAQLFEPVTWKCITQNCWCWIQQKPQSERRELRVAGNFFLGGRITRLFYRCNLVFNSACITVLQSSSKIWASYRKFGSQKVRSADVVWKNKKNKTIFFFLIWIWSATVAMSGDSGCTVLGRCRLKPASASSLLQLRFPMTSSLFQISNPVTVSTCSSSIIHTETLL